MLRPGSAAETRDKVWKESGSASAMRMVNGECPLPEKPGLGFDLRRSCMKIPLRRHPSHGPSLPQRRLRRQVGGVAHPSCEFMKAPIFYRIAAVLLLLFAAGHTLGFRQSDPTWGVDTLLGSMRSIHFDVQGFSRTYWDLFVAAGFSVGVFYLFAAVLAWQLGGLPAETLAVMRVTVWALALCFAAITVVSWRYLFIVPIVFSMVITVCLTAAAWLSAIQSQ